MTTVTTVSISKADYTALDPKDPDTLYLVKDATYVVPYLGELPLSAAQLVPSVTTSLISGCSGYADNASTSASSALAAQRVATAAATSVSADLTATLAHRNAADADVESTRALKVETAALKQDTSTIKAETYTIKTETTTIKNETSIIKSQTQAIYDGVIAVSTFTIGVPYNQGILLDNNTVSITWMDPSDLQTSEYATIAKWAKTRLVVKQGGFPIDQDDGTTLVEITTRNQYRDTPFIFDMGSSSDYYFGLFACSTAGVWNTSDSTPRFTTDLLSWATLSMMSKYGTLLSYPSLEIGSVVDLPSFASFPKIRWKLAHIDYKGNYDNLSDYMGDSSRSHNSVWIPNYLPCWGADNNTAWQPPFDATENEYGENWDEYFLSGRAYYKVVDAAYAQMTAGTDYEIGSSCADWRAAHDNAVIYVKNHNDRKTRGNNIWKESNVRQRLNAVGTGWWTPQNPFDMGFNIATQGFSTDADQWFLDLIAPVNNRTARNTIATASWGGGGGYDVTNDKIWLPSIKEVFNSNNNNIEEGYQFDYFKNVANTNALRIQRDEGGTARGVWLRSPYTSNVSSESCIFTSGSSANNAANYYTAVLPAIVI